MKKKILNNIIKSSNFISIVTPNLNGDKFLEKTLVSVCNQTDQDFEYIVIDGNSTDQSKNIINKYINFIDVFISEKDKSMYHAVDKAINKSSGEVIIWINSDDLLHPDAVKNVKKIFKYHKDINWVTGRSGYIKKGFQFSGIPYIYPRIILQNKLARHDMWGFVQQESISFRKELYMQAKGFDYRFQNACDFNLWTKFCKLAGSPTPVSIKIGYFRTWSGQNSKVFKNQYLRNVGVKFDRVSFRFLRFIVSLLCWPFIVLRTYFLLKKHKSS